MAHGEAAQQLLLFFTLAFANEALAHEVAVNVAASLKSKFGSDILKKPIQSQLLLETCSSFYKKYRKQVLRMKKNQEALTIPDLEIWDKYHKNATEDEILTLIFSKIFEISDVQLAKFLQISTGAVRFRVGKAVRQLGSYSENSRQKRT